VITALEWEEARSSYLDFTGRKRLNVEMFEPLAQLAGFF
jgi:hypothetical protein